MTHRISLLLILLLTFGSSGFGQGIRLDMSIEEFVRNYPDLAPVSARFSGQVNQDTVWHALPWRQAFSFGYGSMSSATWECQPCMDIKTCAPLQSTFEAVSRDFDDCYGPHAQDDPTAWTFYTDPLEAQNAPPETWPKRYWRVDRTQIMLRYTTQKISSPATGEIFSAIGLRIQLSANVKKADGVPCPMAPMMARMPVEMFGALYPSLMDQVLAFRGPRERKERVGGVAGSWTYWFERGKLDFYEWYRGIPDLPTSNQALFDTLNQTVLGLIDQLGSSLGPPSERIENPLVLNSTERTNQVYQKAIWNLKDERIEILLSDFDPEKGFGYFMKWRVSQALPEKEKK